MRVQPRYPGVFSFLLFTVTLAVTTQLAMAGDDNAALPNAPEAVLPAGLPGAPLSNRQHWRKRNAPRPTPRLAKYIGTDQPRVPLSAKEKLELSGWEQLQPYAFATQLFGAGWEQLIDGDPKFGSDSGAFGERLGAAALLQNSRAVLSDGIMAAIFRQDPRYYRQGHRPVKQRIYHAAKRVFVIRSDEGKYQPNYSQLLGNAVATALTMTYYPAASATWPQTAEGYGISLATEALGNEIHEFTPVIKRVILYHHR